jgi:hypothetical protein
MDGGLLSNSVGYMPSCCPEAIKTNSTNTHRNQTSTAA